MSHGDQVVELPEGFRVLAATDSCPFAAVEHPGRRIYGVQFHPEVAHTEQGSKIIANFLFRVCDCSGNWQVVSLVERKVAGIKAQVGNAAAVCGVSGGVDSWVVATLVHKAIGGQLHCVFVDNGLLREGEAEEVRERFKKHLGVEVRFVDASGRFLEALRGLTDPEEKRKVVGREFVEVFKQAVSHIPDVRFLAQGTLYPDRIESLPVAGGPSVTIKSHHNVGGLPEEVGLELLEPIADLFKDEVRQLAGALGLPEEVARRHPFPGPGLAVRLIGEVTPERLEILRAADRIVLEEIRNASLYDKVWQAFAVLLPVSTVGVMGDSRTYENVLTVRVVESTDGMTADWAKLPYELLDRLSTRLINEVRGINRVAYDISSKPPSTIEWE
jgi:GMP synthase (glutamine-hydrolysing)